MSIFHVFFMVSDDLSAIYSESRCSPDGIVQKNKHVSIRSYEMILLFMPIVKRKKENIFPENAEKRHLLCTDAALEELLLL